MQTRNLILVALVASLAVAGCSSRGDKRRTAGDAAPSTPYTEPERPRATPAPRQDGLATSQATGISGISQRVVYFAYDSAEIRPEGLAIIDSWADYLSDNPSARVRLEGHADERGTREYNIGLGERRANAVQQALVARGVSPRQMSVISFGEERPVVLGHDESAWSKNRRVEIVD